MAPKLNRDIKNEVQYFDTLDSITVRRFYAALLDNNLLALVKWPEDLKEAPQEAQNVWDALYKQYTDRIMSTEELRGHLLEGQLYKLTLRYRFAKALLDAIKAGRDEETEAKYVEELKHWGYIADPKKPLVDELKKLYKQLNNSVNKINRLRSEVEEILGERKTEAEEFSLNKLKIKIKMAIDVEVDLDRTTMDEWIIIWEEIDKMAKDSINKRQRAGYE